MRITIRLIPFIVVLTLGVGAVAFAMADSAKPTKEPITFAERAVITVTAKGTDLEAQSECNLFANLGAYIKVDANDAEKQATNAAFDKAKKAINDLLSQAGVAVPEWEYNEGGPNLYDREHVSVGWLFRSTISKDVAANLVKRNDAFKEVAAEFEHGQGGSWSVSIRPGGTDDDYLARAVADAVRNARRQAEPIARELGAEVAGVAHVTVSDERSYKITQPGLIYGSILLGTVPVSSDISPDAFASYLSTSVTVDFEISPVTSTRHGVPATKQ